MLVALMCNRKFIYKSQKYSYALAPKSSASENSLFCFEENPIRYDAGSVQKVQECPTLYVDLRTHQCLWNLRLHPLHIHYDLFPNTKHIHI